MKFRQNKKRIDPRYFLNEQDMLREYEEYVPSEMRSPEFWESPDATEKYKAYIDTHGSKPADVVTHEQAANQTLAAIQGKDDDDEEYTDVTGKIIHPDGSVGTSWSGADALKKAGITVPEPAEKAKTPSRPQHPLLRQQYDFYESGGQPGGKCPGGNCVGFEVMPYSDYLLRATQAKWDLEKHDAKKAEEEQGLQELKLTTPQLKHIIDEVLRGVLS